MKNVIADLNEQKSLDKQTIYKSVRYALTGLILEDKLFKNNTYFRLKGNSRKTTKFLTLYSKLTKYVIYPKTKEKVKRKKKYY